MQIPGEISEGFNADSPVRLRSVKKNSGTKQKLSSCWG